MIFVHVSSRVSGQLLAEMLGSDYVLSREGRISLDDPGGIHVNYGCNRSILPLWSNERNTLNYHINSSNKLNVFRILHENNIPVPETIQLNVGEIAPFDVLCRSDRLSEGRGITFVKRGDRIRKEKDFYTKLESIEEEYRVHVFHAPWEKSGEGCSYIIASSLKYQQIFPYRRGFSREHIENIRSYRNGWRFRRVYFNNLDERIKRYAIESIKALRMNFGAVDIGIKNNGDIVVFEVNSAPGIEESILRRYTEVLNRKICSLIRQR